MSLEAIQNQQIERVVQNTTLRKAAGAPTPPTLTEDETEMIDKSFSGDRHVETYNLAGSVRDIASGRGRNVDTRV